jgi:hypothetical protein
MNAQAARPRASQAGQHSKRGGIVTDAHASGGNFGQLGPNVGLKGASPQNLPEGSADTHTGAGQAQTAEASSGMTVEEEELRAVSAQLVYKMRCECGRSWFELELQTFVKCPACRKVGIVTPLS